jgi:hypothetical protein
MRRRLVFLSLLRVETLAPAYFAAREASDPFVWAASNLAEAEQNKVNRHTVQWRYAILRMHEVIAQAVPYLNEEDLGRFHKKFKTVFVDDSNLRNFCSARPARTRAGTATPASTTALRAGTGAKHRLRLHRQQAFALQLLAGELARAAYGFRPFAGFLLGGFFIMAAELHLAENTLALHLLLQHLQGLIDIVIANENLHAASSSIDRIGILVRQKAGERPSPYP